ncbi:MAG: nucleotide sugar dehydrogenase, partial [Synergistota bacterium]|nr:nucleotide sugar dehydrogenase [Synergistota bacterium]
AIEFARAGFTVFGVDSQATKVENINHGHSVIPDISDEDIAELTEKNKLHATTDYKVTGEVDAISICVPTPLRKMREPDISFVMDAVRKTARYLKKNQLIILESTTYPGTTDEIILPIFSGKGLKEGTDFFLAFSPERIDPGNKVFTTKTIPKVVGGITKKCTSMAKLLYDQICDNVITVSSTRAAELVKLLENTFRSTNIALANEMAIISRHIGIDIWEVVDAAATKPFGFMPFYPGPGLGGHCIPVDPYYLTWKSKQMGYRAKFIELAGEINQAMAPYVVERISDILNPKRKCINGSLILILGVAYKKNVNDSRESPAIEIMNILKTKGAKLRYNDPFIPRITFDGKTIKSAPLNEKLLKQADCTVIITDHSKYDFNEIVSKSKLVMDTRNATRSVKKHRGKIVKL